MNVFFLDKNPAKAAKYHCDKHVVKMIVETAQLLSTAHRVIDGDVHTVVNPGTNRKKKIYLMPGETHEWVQHQIKDKIVWKSKFSTSFYAATHVNHGSAVWCRSNSSNYIWLYHLLVELCKEYTHRYGKVHKTQSLLPLLSKIPKNISEGSFYDAPQMMPDYLHSNDSVESYRNYYCVEKRDMLIYTDREVPQWVLNNF